MIQPNSQRVNLIDAINLILNFNETINETINYLLSAKGYKNAGVHSLKVRKTHEIWASMKDVGNGLGVKNMSDLVLKEIYGISETRNPSKKQINNCKMTEREIYENFMI